jgi:glycosyltransferase involved in cell wall biosynthesis
LFYFEPSGDRWVRFDRYPRKLVRWILPRDRLTGHRQLIRQLRLGLERAGIGCRFNSYRHADRHSDEPIGVLGKTALLDHWHPRNPAVFGPCMLDHPKDSPDLLEKYNGKYYLVPSAWVRDMFARYFGDRVMVWRIGIDLDVWRDFAAEDKSIDFLIYEKFLWNRAENLRHILEPIREWIHARNLTTSVLHCGSYTHDEYRNLLRRCRRMIFLCEHETQGQAYQQALACNVPVLAWDQGFWLDPKAERYEQDRVPASSVPYFSRACGVTFRDIEEFPRKMAEFLEADFAPRSFVDAHLDLVNSARQYYEIVRRAGGHGG